MDIYFSLPSHVGAWEGYIERLVMKDSSKSKAKKVLMGASIAFNFVFSALFVSCLAIGCSQTKRADASDDVVLRSDKNMLHRSIGSDVSSSISHPSYSFAPVVIDGHEYTRLFNPADVWAEGWSIGRDKDVMCCILPFNGLPAVNVSSAKLNTNGLDITCPYVSDRIFNRTYGSDKYPSVVSLYQTADNDLSFVLPDTELDAWPSNLPEYYYVDCILADHWVHMD
jgi:hypothetical protein